MMSRDFGDFSVPLEKARENETALRVLFHSGRETAKKAFVVFAEPALHIL
jgi:hypothetical protein